MLKMLWCLVKGLISKDGEEETKMQINGASIHMVNRVQVCLFVNQ